MCGPKNRTTCCAQELAPPLLEGAAAPAAPAAAAGAVATGVPVSEGVVLFTASQRRRQRRELRANAVVAACMRTADAVCETLPSNSVLLCLGYLGASFGAVGAVLVQQAAAPPVGGAVHLSCVQLHAVVISVQLLSTSTAMLVGNAELCWLWCGTDGTSAQHHRLAILAWLLVLETVVLLPLVWPLALAPEPSVGGACEIDSSWMALVRSPTPAHALTALATTFFFLQRAVTIGTAGIIFGSLMIGVIVERPVRVLAAGALLLLVGCALCAYCMYWRRVANASIWLVATIDQLLAEAVHATTGSGRVEGTLSTMGRAVRFLADPETVGHCTPAVSVALVTVLAGMVANLAAVFTGIV